MNNEDIINFPSSPEELENVLEDLAIKIDRQTPEFMKATHDVGDYLKTLPLSNIQHNNLVELLGVQIDVAEKGGFYSGFKIGLHVGKDAALNGGEL